MSAAVASRTANGAGALRVPKESPPRLGRPRYFFSMFQSTRRGVSRMPFRLLR